MRNDYDLHYLSLMEAANLIQHRAISSTDLTSILLKRIEKLDGSLNCYATVMTDQALAAARQADEELASGRYRGPLHGVPIAVKDLCFTKGVRTMGGTAVLADFVPEYSATVVTRLEDAGAVLLGKLNLTEGAMGRYHPKLEIPRNPWNESVSAGSSSSGSGVATAAGLAYGTLGSDTGGSIRFPAAACGVVGLKPTWGRVSRYGVLALADSLDHVGPITRTVADAAVLLQTIAGPDTHDPTSWQYPLLPDLLGTIDTGVMDLRIGIDEEYIHTRSHRGQAEAVMDAVNVLASLGAKIVPVALPDFDAFTMAWATLCSAEAVLAHAVTFPVRRDEYGPGFRDWLDRGAAITGSDYAEANNVRAACNGHLRQLFQNIDLLATPSTIEPPGPVSDTMLYGGRKEFDASHQRFTVPFDYNGAPTLSLPCGFTADGLPFSLQLIGHPFDEQRICQAGYAYEQATDWHQKHPPV